MLALRAAGHSDVLLKRRVVRNMGKNIAAPVLPDLQGKGHVRQRSISAESVFGSFCRHKRNSPRGK